MSLIHILKYFYQSLHPEVRFFLRNYGITFLAKKILVLIKFGFLKKITLDNGLILSLASDHDYELRANYLSDILANNFETPLGDEDLWSIDDKNIRFEFTTGVDAEEPGVL